MAVDDRRPPAEAGGQDRSVGRSSQAQNDNRRDEARSRPGPRRAQGRGRGLGRRLSRAPRRSREAQAEVADRTRRRLTRRPTASIANSNVQPDGQSRSPMPHPGQGHRLRAHRRCLSGQGPAFVGPDRRGQFGDGEVAGSGRGRRSGRAVFIVPTSYSNEIIELAV